MSDFKITCEWLSAGQDAPELRDTTAQLALHVGGLCLTQNQDVWSKTVRDSVLVSAYPLALWLAGSWWRLNGEPLPKPGGAPSLDWRMGHELGAANSGYVWPQVVMASDGEAMQIWATASEPDSGQSVRYLNSLSAPRAVALADFQRGVDEFVAAVLSRLHAVGCPDTDLAQLWRLVQADRADPASAQRRRLEAQLGYDPEDCPESVMTQALALQAHMGATTLAELAPIYSSGHDGPSTLGRISELAHSAGLQGQPQVSLPASTTTSAAPWQRAVDTARTLRQQLGNTQNPITDTTLYDLLGLQAAAVSTWTPPARHPVALAVPADHGQLHYVPRKRHPVAKRFEFSRFLGDYLGSAGNNGQWLASTDLSTARQKYQRAFAAEFLCPIDALVDFLHGDYSESAIEEVATDFGVSEQTVESLLANNGYITPTSPASGLPY